MLDVMIDLSMETFFFRWRFSLSFSKWKLGQTGKVYLQMIVGLKYKLKLHRNIPVFIEGRKQRSRRERERRQRSRGRREIRSLPYNDRRNRRVCHSLWRLILWTRALIGWSEWVCGVSCVVYDCQLESERERGKEKCTQTTDAFFAANQRK